MYQLVRLSTATLPIVRSWRNASHVREFMFYREYITQAKHDEWFAGLDKRHNFYYVYTAGVTPVGLVNLKNMDDNKRTAEAGMFCGDLDYVGHYINIFAPIKLYQYAFENLKLDLIYAKIQTKNLKAIQINKFIGFSNIQQEADSVTMHLHQTVFSSRVHRFSNIISNIKLIS